MASTKKAAGSHDDGSSGVRPGVQNEERLQRSHSLSKERWQSQKASIALRVSQLNVRS